MYVCMPPITSQIKLSLLRIGYENSFVGEILSVLIIGVVVEISTLLLFARIFLGQKFKCIIWAVGLFTSIYSIVVVHTVIFQCRRVKRIGDSAAKAECIDTSKIFVVMSSSRLDRGSSGEACT